MKLDEKSTLFGTLMLVRLNIGEWSEKARFIVFRMLTSNDQPKTFSSLAVIWKKQVLVLDEVSSPQGTKFHPKLHCSFRFPGMFLDDFRRKNVLPL